jgi:hypothetical protein
MGDFAIEEAGGGGMFGIGVRARYGVGDWDLDRH